MTDLIEYLEKRLDKFEAFEDREHADLKHRLQVIEDKVDSLRMSRERLYGIAAGLGAIAGYLAKFI